MYNNYLTLPIPRLKQLASLFFLISITSSSFSQTFEYKDSGTSFLLYDLSIPPGQDDVAFAAGSEFTVNSEGIIIKTEDGGETWQTVLSGTTNGFTRIAFITPLKGFAVGWNDTFIKTEDGGTTWENVSAGTDIFYYSSLEFFDENIGFAGALNNSSSLDAFITTDGGDNWVPTSDTANMAEFSACYADANTLYSVGMDQQISKSTDGGDTWTVIQTGTPTIYNLEVAFKDADNGIVSTEDGTLSVTDDGGSSWTSFSTGFHNFYALEYIDNQLFAAGTDQDVFISNDNGASWTFVHDGPPVATFYSIEFFENGVGLICGSQGTILKVEDAILSTEETISAAGMETSYDPDLQLLQVVIPGSQLDLVRIYSIEGKMVKEIHIEGPSVSEIDLSELANGVYIIEAISNNLVSTSKVLKY